MSTLRAGGRVRRVAALAAVLAAGVACDDLVFGPQPEPPLSQGGIVGVREIVDANCLSCHSADAALGQLDLETDVAAALVDVPASSGEGVLVVPGDPDASVFLRKIRGTQEVGNEMPPGTGGLPAQALDLVEDWILDGAPGE